MKKVLIASSALLLGAGAAAAQEATIDGSARFGLAYNDANADDFRIEQRLRINLRGSTTTDAGLELSARFRLESNEAADNSIAGRGPGAAEFTAETGGFRLDVGNTSDVIDSGDVVDYYGFGIGLTSFIEHNSAFYDAGDVDAGNGLGLTLPIGGFGAGDSDVTTIKVRYTAGDFTVAASYSEDRNTAPVDDVEEMQIGVGYNFGNYSVGVAYGNQDGGVEDFWVATFGGDIGALGFSVVVGDSDVFEDVAYGFSVSYDVGAATEIRFAVSDGGADVAGVSDDTAVGIGFRHSLGGGVTLAGGVGQGTAGQTLADLGVSFSF
ncbi:MAG: porin [Tateyamaria sp.]